MKKKILIGGGLALLAIMLTPMQVAHSEDPMDLLMGPGSGGVHNLECEDATLDAYREENNWGGSVDMEINDNRNHTAADCTWTYQKTNFPGRLGITRGAATYTPIYKSEGSGTYKVPVTVTDPEGNPKDDCVLTIVVH